MERSKLVFNWSILFRVSLDFSIAELNKLFILYHKKEIEELKDTIDVDLSSFLLYCRAVMRIGKNHK